MPMMPISYRASFTPLSFSSRKMASIFLVMLFLLLSGSGICPFAMLADIESNFLFIFSDPQSQPAMKEFGEHKGHTEGECNGDDYRKSLNEKLSGIAIE